MRKRSVVIEAQPTSMVILGDKVEATLVRNPKYIEEKIEYLQEQISELRRDLGQESKERCAKIDSLSKELSAKTQETKSALGDLKSKMEKVFVGGGVMVGLLGVLLLFYGAIAGYFT